MKSRKLSSLTRSIDLEYPTNRAIVLISLLFIFGIAGSQLALGRGVSLALYSGLRGGVSVFLSWAFARELDPDNEYSAFFSAFLGLTGFIIFRSPLLFALLLELLLIRMVNRSTGLPAKTFDSFTVLLLSGWLSLQENWTFGLFTGLAFILDSLLPEPKRQNRIFGMAALIISGFTLMTSGEDITLPDMQSGLFILTASILFIPIVLSSREVRSIGDLTGTPLNPIRVQTAQLTALLNVGLLTFLQRWDGVETLMPLWGAILGVSLYRYHQKLLNIKKEEVKGKK